jgi:hypothetical protein
LKAHGLRLHPRKCKFFQESVEYLGHVIRWFGSATSQGGGYCTYFASHGCE